MPALGAGGGQGGIGGDPGAIEAAADQVRAGAAAIGAAGESVSGRGDAVVARWQGSASDAAHERIRFLGARTEVGADALSGLPKVLGDYAQALRDAQAAYAAGQLAAGVAATSHASATTAIAAIEAETTGGTVPGNDPGHVGRQRQAGAALDAAVEAGQVAAAQMAGAIAAEQVANAVAAGQVNAITGLMAGMAATVATGLSPAAADWADGYRATPAPQAKGAGAPAMAVSGLPDPHPGNDPQGRPLPSPRSDAEIAAMDAESLRALDITQQWMEAAGILPVVGVPIDVANAGIYALRGDWDNAAFSIAAAVPLAGDAAAGTRLLLRGKGALEAADQADQALQDDQDGVRAPAPAAPGPVLGPPAATQQDVKDARIAALQKVADADAAKEALGVPAQTYASPPSSKPPWPGWTPGQPKPMDGPLYVHPPKNPTAEQILDAQRYADAAQVALDNDGFSPTGRVSTQGEPRAEASAAARYERDHPSNGIPYTGVAGHVPDTTFGRGPEPYSWLDMNLSVNSSIGAQSLQYPYNYKPDVVLGPLDQGYIDDVVERDGARFSEWQR